LSKNGLGSILGDFYKNSFGHPALGTDVMNITCGVKFHTN
jgi:hypothetical protein